MTLIIVVLLCIVKSVVCLSSVEKDGLRQLQRQFVPDWFGWSGEPSCEWKGVVCGFDREVLRLHLANLRKTKTTLPYLFDSFPHLAVLDLSNNQLFGTIPVHFERLSALNSLSLQANAFSGVIPSNFAKLTDLTRLNLSKNSLFGVGK
jgi:hypothetical protein